MKKTHDALDILKRRHPVQPGSRRAERMAKYERDLQVAQDLYAMRTEAGLTQEQLAKKVGTSRSVIARLEDADYRGHSVRMLERIAEALEYRVEIRFAPIAKRPSRKTSERQSYLG